MAHLSVASPERFCDLDSDPARALGRLRGQLARGAVRPEHLLVASDDEADVGRVCLYALQEGITLAHALSVTPGRGDTQEAYRVLLDGVADLARVAGLDSVCTTVVDEDEREPRHKRAALATAGWEPDGDRLELEAPTRVSPRPAAIVELDPSDPAVVGVMAQAMADSLDDYDREQVAALGPERAAVAYRDTMVGDDPVPWLAHRGDRGIDAVAAIMAYPEDWCLGYLGVVPAARRRGVGAALAEAMLSSAAEAGSAVATASVAVANGPVRATLERVGFTVCSTRTDFVLRLA